MGPLGFALVLYCVVLLPRAIDSNRIKSIFAPAVWDNQNVRYSMKTGTLSMHIVSHTDRTVMSVLTSVFIQLRVLFHVGPHTAKS